MLKYLLYAMIVIVAVWLILGVLLVRNYMMLERAQLINARELQISVLVHNRGKVTASDVTLIRPWMTFDYIDRLFGVPETYLKTDLSIMDASYPGLSLSGYAKHQGISSAVVQSEVQNALSLYLFTTSTISTSTTK